MTDHEVSTYEGGCHCGKVQAAPLPAGQDQRQRALLG